MHRRELRDIAWKDLTRRGCDTFEMRLIGGIAPGDVPLPDHLSIGADFKTMLCGTAFVRPRSPLHSCFGMVRVDRGKPASSPELSCNGCF